MPEGGFPHRTWLTFVTVADCPKDRVDTDGSHGGGAHGDPLD